MGETPELDGKAILKDIGGRDERERARKLCCSVLQSAAAGEYVISSSMAQLLLKHFASQTAEYSALRNEREAHYKALEAEKAELVKALNDRLDLTAYRKAARKEALEDAEQRLLIAAHDMQLLGQSELRVDGYKAAVRVIHKLSEKEG